MDTLEDLVQSSIIAQPVADEQDKRAFKSASPLLNQSIAQPVADEQDEQVVQSASPSLNQLKAQVNPAEALKAFRQLKIAGSLMLNHTG